MNWTEILVTAACSSLFTLVVVGVLLHVWVLPEVERHVDRKAEETARRVEQQLRQRIAQGFAETTDVFREVLVGRAGQVAKGTADIVGDGVRRFFDRIGTRPPSGDDGAA